MKLLLRKVLNQLVNKNQLPRHIALRLGLPIHSVVTVQRRLNKMKLTWHEIQEMSDEQLLKNFAPRKKVSIKHMPDFKAIHKEIQTSPVTIKQCYEKYCQENSLNVHSNSSFAITNKQSLH